MSPTNTKPLSRKRTVKGSGFIGTVLNKAIDALPVELHLPGGYRYCGPGTRLKERLARGDPGINGLDEACKEHDIAYSLYKDNFKRKLADQRLAESAWKRVKSSDASLGERAAAWSVTTAMKAKSKLGGRLKKKRGSKKGAGPYLRPGPKAGRGAAKKGGFIPLAAAIPTVISAVPPIVKAVEWIVKR